MPLDVTEDERAGADAGPQGRSPEADKRHAIIEAARSLFTTVGYESTTIARVAGEAGVAVGTVYLYFKNKNDLLLAVKADWEAQVMAALIRPELSSIPFHLRVRPIIEAAFDICARHTEMVQLMGMQAEMIGEHRPQPSPPIYGVMKAFFDEGRAAGTIREVNTEAVAVLTYGMFNGALQQCFVVEGGKNRRVYIDALADAVQQWLVKPELLHDSGEHAAPARHESESGDRDEQGGR
jgi:AcrR family transcriptional regulator